MHKSLSSFAFSSLILFGGWSLGTDAGAATLISTTTLSGAITSTGTGPQGDYGKQYEGQYTVTASFTINTIMVGGMWVVDPTTSFVTFTDTTKNFGPFDTLAIPITSATGDLESGDITGFSFMATNWYKNLPGNLTQNGLSGNLVIVGPETSTMTGSYKHIPRDPTKGTTVLNYTFTSPATAPFPGPDEFIPFPVPEPETWTLLILGFGAVGSALRLARRGRSFASAVA